MDRAALIERRLRAALAPTSLEIADDSRLHAGHAGAQSGGGHFSVTIVSPRFRGQTTIGRHRMVYEALGELMQKDIHALRITALTPEES
ncbi:MAG: BolA family protein [Candidatus Muproteobacteria bacterium RIFCSPHIGHO2_01_FULL_65_16]|uniref:BolA family protein n=3 Tax=Candidatus Muproteobacteria TaxID=1817795 RepID=A0A1F6TGC5_9PROT|nr:MAG: BolA family protein [Candidatus Muproteobacteria bacterium RBG_16_65_31]OGI47237.1 MAG: BolA family protein [Candidatus Muproteobacteria bacterium RIFCSPHIGHO2_01_FULL_65_16]OGI52225.1 MAG: BolA family protein [Candidatus Muproteobacteria bacterium RIFCSPHIGHO2_02_FULL_65_16]